MAALTITASSVLAAAGSQLKTGTAGATIAAGDAVYLLGATYLLADADLEPSAEVAGIALNSAEATQPFDFIVSGTLTVGVTTPVTAAGLAYYLSPTAGRFDNAVPAAGDFVTLLAIALTSTTMSINIHASGVEKPA